MHACMYHTHTYHTSIATIDLKQMFSHACTSTQSIYTYIHACMYVYNLCIHVYMDASMYTCIHGCMHVYCPYKYLHLKGQLLSVVAVGVEGWLNLHLYVYVCQYVCTYVCMHVCVFVRMHVCTQECMNVSIYVCMVCMCV